MRSQLPIISSLRLRLCLVLALSIQPQLVHCATAGERGLQAGSILRSDRINDGTFHRSQSKRAATLAKSQPLISATTQIAKTNEEQTTTATIAAATAALTTIANATQTNANLSIHVAIASAAATELPNRSNINNISNNDSNDRQQRGATSVPGVRAALQANLIMSNRNVEEQEFDAHKYKITQHNALFPASSSNNNNNGSTSTIEATTAAATTVAIATEESTTTTSTTTTTTTTRRPAPKTTLKPPPTIDDYQTIISQAGTHAYLPCNVKQLVKKPISWLRMRDGHILTVDQTTFIADQRFQSVFSPNPERWSLQIKYVQLKDEGTYECQVSTEPKASAIVHLRIVEPKTELIGESTRHVKAGSQVKLRCIISQALEPPLFINWFYNQKQIYLHNRRGWRTEIERIDLPAEVPTTSTTAATSTSTAAAASLNDIAAITRSYILDAITVSDGADTAGYGYVLPTTGTPTPMPTPTPTPMPTMSTTTAAAASEGGAAAAAVDTLATTAAAAVAAATMTTATSAATTTTATEPSTTTAVVATTTTMVPSSSFIKQITTASLIIPAVVKLDSGNYTCSPSNSAPRTIVLHVLNGEYSASAIKSASVSWNTLIGCPGYLQGRNISTLLTLLWIIKFVLARNVTIRSNHGRNKVNKRPTLQEPQTTRTTSRTTAGESVSSRLGAQTETTTRRQQRFGFGGGNCGHVSSSISGTKVAEDKT